MSEERKLTHADLEAVYESLQKEDHRCPVDKCPVCGQPVYVLYPQNPTGICYVCYKNGK